MFSENTFSLKYCFAAARQQGESDVTDSRNRVPGQETLTSGAILSL